MLRRRVAFVLLALMVATALLLRGLLWLGDEWVEDAAVKDLLENQLTLILHSGVAPPAGSDALRYFRPSDPRSAPLPAEFTALKPRVHEDVKAGGARWRVLVREIAPGDRAYLAYDVGFLEARESLLVGFASGGLMVLLFAAWALSRRIAALALAPFETLVGQVRSLDPQRPGQRLTTPEPDGDLSVIVHAINNHLSQLEALVERERAFAASASHELRTPLSLIQGSAEQLAATPGAEPRVAERLRRGIREATQKLEALLALSRTRESPPLESLALADWLPAASESLLAGSDAAGRVRWVVTPAQLVAPPGAARIVFGNLLQNALLADPKGEVTVTVAPGSVTVEDRGPGMAADVLGHVFEPGFRGREGGSGMGLYIARAIADRYGWTLSLLNREGGGARAEWRF